jgi:hypothetical protein
VRQVIRLAMTTIPALMGFSNPGGDEQNGGPHPSRRLRL